MPSFWTSLACGRRLVCGAKLGVWSSVCRASWLCFDAARGRSGFRYTGAGGARWMVSHVCSGVPLGWELVLIRLPWTRSAAALHNRGTCPTIVRFVVVGYGASGGGGRGVQAVSCRDPVRNRGIWPWQLGMVQSGGRPPKIGQVGNAPDRISSGEKHDRRGRTTAGKEWVDLVDGYWKDPGLLSVGGARPARGDSGSRFAHEQRVCWLSRQWPPSKRADRQPHRSHASLLRCIWVLGRRTLARAEMSAARGGASQPPPLHSRSPRHRTQSPRAAR